MQDVKSLYSVFQHVMGLYLAGLTVLVSFALRYVIPSQKLSGIVLGVVRNVLKIFLNVSCRLVSFFSQRLRYSRGKGSNLRRF